MGELAGTGRQRNLPRASGHPRPVSPGRWGAQGPFRSQLPRARPHPWEPSHRPGLSSEAAERAGAQMARPTRAQGRGRGSRPLTACPAGITVLDDRKTPVREFLGHPPGSPGTPPLSLCSWCPLFLSPSILSSRHGRPDFLACACAPGRQAHVTCEPPEVLGTLPGTVDSDTEGPGPPPTQPVMASQLRARPELDRGSGSLCALRWSGATRSGPGCTAPAGLGLGLRVGGPVRARLCCRGQPEAAALPRGAFALCAAPTADGVSVISTSDSALLCSG